VGEMRMFYRKLYKEQKSICESAKEIVQILLTIVKEKTIETIELKEKLGEIEAKCEWQEQQLESLRQTKSSLLEANKNLQESRNEFAERIEELNKELRGLKGGKDNG
jgi:predicted nuclease with TOPRIM domain